MTETRALTAKGAATRRRIVANAADQVLARGVGGTSLTALSRDIEAELEALKRDLN